VLSSAKVQRFRLTPQTLDHVQDFRDRHVRTLAASQSNVASGKLFQRDAPRSVLYLLYLDEVNVLNNNAQTPPLDPSAAVDQTTTSIIKPLSKSSFYILLGGSDTVDSRAAVRTVS
jgi:hypothetical protein